MRSGMPQRFPEGELSGVFRSPWASSQTSARRPLRAASPSIAPMCAQQQPPSTSGRSGRSIAIARFCSPSESSSTTAASGYGRGSRAASAIASPPSPQARGTRTRPARKLAAAGVALVARTERNRGVGMAVRTAGTETAHTGTSSSRVRAALQVGKLPGRHGIGRLSQAVDPDRGQRRARLQARRRGTGWPRRARPACDRPRVRKCCQCTSPGLYEPISDATIASSNGTSSRRIDASMKSRSVLERMASFQPRSRDPASASRTSGNGRQSGSDLRARPPRPTARRAGASPRSSTSR